MAADPSAGDRPASPAPLPSAAAPAGSGGPSAAVAAGTDASDRHGLVGLAARSGIGGLLMGVANLVPGISGGAMLLLLGVYTKFLSAIAEVVTFKFRLRSIIVLGLVGTGAATTILVLAGLVKDLIVTHRWQTYSVVIGMRLAAIPVVWRLARPATPSLWMGMAAGIVLTGIAAVFVYMPSTGAGPGSSSPGMLFLGGLLGSSATILPGLDGSYILMLLDQYVPILASIDRFGDGLKAGNISAATAEFGTLVPVGLGVLLGIGGVSLVVRKLLMVAPKPTYGVLIGILVGAFIGLYPFGAFVPPQVGDVIKGTVMTEANLPQFVAKPEDWPVKFFAPTTGQVMAAIGLIVAGAVAAWGLSKFDRETPEPNQPAQAKA